MNIFYCPKCKKNEKDLKYSREDITWLNCRDGYGRGITHIICPYCGYELSGNMSASKNIKEDEMEYIKHVISLYSDNKFIDVDKVIESIRESRKKEL